MEPVAKKLLTLAFIHDDERILLGLKKRGVGEGYWNGFGGKVQEGETIEMAARREMLEESGITVEELQQRGVITFHFKDNPQPWEVHLFRVTRYSGDPTETEEMRPQWHAHADIPYDRMWQDDRDWMPHFLKGNYITASFEFDGHIKVGKQVSLT